MNCIHKVSKLVLATCLLCSLTWPARAGVEFNAAPLLNQARLYLDEGRFFECMDAWHQVYQYSRNPEEQVLGLVRVADILALFLDQKEQALTLYHQARKEYDTFSALENAYFNAGMIEYELNRPGPAQTSFRRFIELFPSSFRSATARYMLQHIEENTAETPPTALKTGKPPTEDAITPESLTVAEPEPKAELKPEAEAAAAPVELLETSIPHVRVALEQATTVTLRFNAPVDVVTQDATQRWPAGEYHFTNAAGQLQTAGAALGRSIALTPSEDRFFWQNRPYHGRALLRLTHHQVLLVNQVALETYLEGVVPKEMPASWELEALKAQAVSARSYAYYILLKSEDKDYDVAATTASQVYGGADQGNAASRRAVADTHGRILTYEQQPVLTYFHSHSGGMLEDAGLVWSGSSLPYYQVRNDDVSQQFRPMTWEIRIPANDVAAALRRNGFNVQRVSDLQAAETSASGRLVSVKAVTDGGNITLRANSLRLWLGAAKMKSVLTSIEKTGDGFRFKGRGFGHGVGMSQWGAQGMARRGARYEDILAHYYPGTAIQTIYVAP